MKTFKRLCRIYLRLQRSPSAKDMESIWRFKRYIDFEDFVVWKQQVGLKRGVIFEEDGTIIFEEWPVPPHDEIIDEFNSQYDRQLKSFYANTPYYPLWVNHGATGTSLSFTIQSDFLDIRIPGRRKQPDSAWGPKNRPHLPLPNPYATLIPTQTNGTPFPTLILEVGNSQSIPDLVQIRDKALGWKTGINIFVLIAYNRNSTHATDSWFIQVSHRDFTAPQPPPTTGDTYPSCIVMFETAKIRNRYPLVNTPIPPADQIWTIPTSHLYFPESIPVLNPLIPAAFDINIEMIRQTITSER